MLSASRVFSNITSKVLARSYSQAAPKASSKRSLLSSLMGPQETFRGSDVVYTSAPTNAIETFLYAPPFPTGEKGNLTAIITQASAKRVADDLIRTFPNTFESTLAKPF